MSIRARFTGPRLRYVAAGLLAVALAAVGLRFALAPRTYQAPDGEYVVRYPRNWEPLAANGLVTFSAPEAGREGGARVAIVLARMAPDWRKDFEEALGRQFAALGGRYVFRDKGSLTVNGQTVARYRYDLEMGGKSLRNTVYVYAADPDRAVVLTCSAPPRDDPALETQFAVFYQSLRRQP